MSTVHCRHCDAPNPSGSRFCNGCGAPLPPGTNLICPNCQTANPHHLLYCDNCGTRLVQDEWPTEEDTPKQGPREPFSLPERELGDTGELDPDFIPDWLKTGESPILESVDKNLIGDWLNQLADPDTSGGESERETQGERPAWLDEVQGDLGAEEETPTPVEADSQADLLAQADIPDWLADLSALQNETEEETPEEAPLPDWMNQADTGLAAGEARSDDDLEVPAWLRDEAPSEAGGDAFDADVLDANELDEWFDAVSATEEAAGDEGEDAAAVPEAAAEDGDEEGAPPPDFLFDLEEALAAAEEEAGDVASDEIPDVAMAGLEPATLPEWLTDIRPEESEIEESEEIDIDALLASVEESGPEIEDTALHEDVPDYLASDELPTWMETPAEASPPSAADDAAPPANVTYDDLPAWLMPEESAPSFDDALEAALDVEGEAGDRSGGAIIFEDDLVPDPGEQLARPADIPDWLEALRPSEDEITEAGDDPVSPPVIPEDAPVEMTGPLAGLKGIVPIEAVIAQPHPAQSVRRLEVSPDQARQMALLRQLLHEGPKQEATVAAPQRSVMPLMARLLLGSIVLVALLVGLFLPSLLTLGNLFLPPAAQNVQQAMAAAAGEPVLVAYDFTPAMAGELLPLAESLAVEASANGSQLLLLTQEPTALGLYSEAARRLDAQIVGYLPGNAVGLRRLATCLDGGECATLLGRSLSGNVADIALVIVVTGDRDHLVDWIEQVGATGETPIVAAVTQALGPTAAPYADSGQLSGVIEGLPALNAYQQNYGDGAGALDLLRAQSVGQWTAVLMLIMGALWYGVVNRTSRRRPS